jgi:hypothetical protein
VVVKVRVSLDYFLALESDLKELSRFIEFSEDNYSVYSLELTRLLLATGSEIDVACKELVHLISPDAKPRTINDYRDIILNRFPEISTQQVNCRRLRLSFVPWKDWHNSSPSWWKSYNQVKHDRLQNYKQASLQNVLLAVAGLGVIMQFFGDSVLENFVGDFFDHHLRIQIFPSRQ